MKVGDELAGNPISQRETKHEERMRVFSLSG